MKTTDIGPCKAAVAVVVRGGRMYLRLTADGRSVDIPFDSGKAERFRRRIEQLVPYNYRTVVASAYTFSGERPPLS